MNRNAERNREPTLAEQTPSAPLDAFLFKDGLWELIQELMAEGDWSAPQEVEHEEFVEAVFGQMQDDVRGWVRRAARYFLNNSEYFLSNREALEIFDEELTRQGGDASDSVRQAFLEFLYRDFPNFCSQSIRMALEDMTAPKH